MCCAGAAHARARAAAAPTQACQPVRPPPAHLNPPPPRLHVCPLPEYHYSYNRYLSRARFHPLNLLEIGLGCDMGYGPGASMKLWRAFLPCSNISFVEFDR